MNRNVAVSTVTSTGRVRIRRFALSGSMTCEHDSVITFGSSAQWLAVPARAAIDRRVRLIVASHESNAVRLRHLVAYPIAPVIMRNDHDCRDSLRDIISGVRQRIGRIIERAQSGRVLLVPLRLFEVREQERDSLSWNGTTDGAFVFPVNLNRAGLNRFQCATVRTRCKPPPAR